VDNLSQSDTDEKIDLIELVRKLWTFRKLFLRVFLGVILFGIMVAFLWPVEYESITTLLPESTGSSSRLPAANLLRSLGGFIDTESSLEGDISKELYPEYIQSTPFLLRISNKEIHITDPDTTISVHEYFSEVRRKPFIEYLRMYTIGLPGLLISLPDRIERGTVKNEDFKIIRDTSNFESEIYALTNEQISIQNQIKERIIATLNENGTITISVKMPDPMASAQMAQNSVELLTEFITRYRTGKFKENLEFITSQYRDAKTKFNEAQRELALFRDQNANIVSARIQTEQQKLETEFQLAADLYRTMAQQMEQAKIKLQEQKPVFTVLEPVQIPNNKSEPDRKLLLVVSIFLGVVLVYPKMLKSNHSKIAL